MFGIQVVNLTVSSHRPMQATFSTPLFPFGTINVQNHTMNQQPQDHPWEPAWERPSWMVFYSVDLGWATRLRFHILPCISLDEEMITEKWCVELTLGALFHLCEDGEAVDEADFHRLIGRLHWSLEDSIKCFLKEKILFSFFLKGPRENEEHRIAEVDHSGFRCWERDLYVACGHFHNHKWSMGWLVSDWQPHFRNREFQKPIWEPRPKPSFRQSL